MTRYGKTQKDTPYKYQTSKPDNPHITLRVEALRNLLIHTDVAIPKFAQTQVNSKITVYYKNRVEIGFLFRSQLRDAHPSISRATTEGSCPT